MILLQITLMPILGLSDGPDPLPNLKPNSPQRRLIDFACALLLPHSQTSDLVNQLHSLLFLQLFGLRISKVDKEVTFADYLDIIKEWHGRSKEMVEYITTPVGSDDKPDSTPKDDLSDKEMEDTDKLEEKSEKTEKAER